MNSIIVRCPACGTGNRIPLLRQHLRPKCGKCGVLLPMAGTAAVVALTDSDLAGAVKGADLPLVVDFYSPSCGPCRMMAPTLEALAIRFFGRAILAKIDVSANPAGAREYGIRGVPTLLFFKKGLLLDQVSGALPESALAARIEALLLRSLNP